MAPRGSNLLIIAAILLLLANAAAQTTSPSIYFPPSQTPPSPPPRANFTVTISGATSYMTSQIVTLGASIRPDGTVSRYAITWSCVVLSSRNSTSGSACPFSDQVSAANGGTQLYVRPRPSDYGQFLFTISVVEKGNASNAASASVTVQLQGTSPPTNVAISVTEGDLARFNPATKLVLQGSYSTVWYKDQVSVRWYQAPSDAIQVNLSSLDVTSTGAKQGLLAIKPNVLTPGQSYTIVFTVTDPGGSSSANMTVSVNKPPRPISPPGLTVSPSSGTPLSTNFTISADGLWSDTAPPLQYRFSYSLPGGNAPSIQLTSFRNSGTVVSVLPSGLTAGNYHVTIYVDVMDSAGLVGSAHVAVTSQWAPSAISDVTATSDNILSSIDSAVSSGQSSTALVYINGLSALLNGNSGSAGGSPTAQQSKSSRFQMLQAVRSISGSFTSGAKSTLVSGLVSVAGTLSGIVAVPSEMTSASQSAAISILSASLATVVSADLALTSVSAQPVFDTLSSLQQVSGTTAEHGLEMKGVAQQVGQALLQGVNAGEAPICVASSGIAISVQRSDGSADLSVAAGTPGSDCSSALTSATFTVPSKALPSGTEIDSQVLVVEGDPYHTDRTLLSTGVSSLTLRKPDGSELAVKGLTNVVTFSMPLNVTGVSAGSSLGSSARCEYFDEKALEYETGGCAALPNPHPPGRSVSWGNSAVLKKGQTIEHLWSIDLTDTNCVDATGLKDTLGNGFRRFNPASTTVNCTLNDPQQTCFFNETLQTFQGPGCMFDNTLYCACTHLTDFAALFAPPDVYILSFADLGALGSAYKTPIPLVVMGILAVVMVVGDLLMRYFVRSQRRLLFVELMSSETDGGWKGICRYGFKAMPNGAYTWSFHEEPKGARYTGADDMNGDGKVNDADAFPGPGPLLAGKLGIYYSRVCTALPTYTFITHAASSHNSRAPSPFPFSNSRAPSALGGDAPPANATPTARSSTPVSQTSPLTARSSTPASRLSTPVSQVNTPVSQADTKGGRMNAPGGLTGKDDPERSSPDSPLGDLPELNPTGIEEPAIVGESVVSRFVGTALVLGYLDAWGVLTSAECSNYVSLAAAYFEQQGLLVARDSGEVKNGGAAYSLARQHALLVDFRAYMEKLKVMLWNNLNRRGWRRRAQIWRLVLLQQKDGSYDLHSDFARALRAPGIDDLDFAAQLVHQQRRFGGGSLKLRERIPDTPQSLAEKPLLAQSPPGSPKAPEPKPAELKGTMSNTATTVMAGLKFKERRGEEDIHIFLDRNQTSAIATARSAHVKLLHDMKDLFDYLAWRVERSTGRVGVQFNTVLDLPHHQNLLDKKVYKQPHSRHINEQISRLSDVHPGMSLLCLYRANLAPRTSMRPRWWLKKIKMLEGRRSRESEEDDSVEEPDVASVHIENELFENATIAVAQKTPESLRSWAEAQPIPQGILGFVSAKVAEHEQALFANKVWATVLGCAFTRRQTETWLRTIDGGDGNPRAVFHSARAWLDDVVGDQSLIDTWMEDADKVLDQWEEQLKQALQDVMKAVDTATVLKHLRKEGSRLLWQIRTLTLKGTWNVITRRKLLAVFLSTERWLSALIQRPGFVVRVCCVWLGSLMINTWMHYSRTIKCCDSLKSQLCSGAIATTVGLCGLSCETTGYVPGCLPNQAEPSCGALLNVYGDFDAHGCTSFPNGSTSSNVCMSVISLLLLFPVQIGMAMLFTMSISSHVLLARWASEGIFASVKRTLVGLFSRQPPPRPVPLPPPQMEQHPRCKKGRNAVAPSEPSSPRALLSSRLVSDEAEGLVADVEKARKKHTWLVGTAYGIAALFFGACALVIAIFSVKLYQDVGKGHENDVLKAYLSAVVLQQCVWTGTKYLLKPAQDFLKESALYYFFIKLFGDMFSWEEGLRDLGGFIASLNIDLSLLTQAGGAFAVEAAAAANHPIPVR